jgi:serine/threonine protein kinase
MTAKESVERQETIGSYDLLEKLAEGSMGVVYKARHWETSQIVAIKVLSKDVARNPVVLKRFEQEFRVASKLDHPNVVKVLEYSAGDNPFLVMEYIDGESLGAKLERGGRLPEEESLAIIIQVAHGLHRAHRQGMIHRDIKPDNILVTPEGKAKLTDLGLAKDSSDGATGLTKTGRGLGTPNYMAPEQFRNAKNASIRCDIYSLGATLYQMVTGELPFGVSDPVQVMMRKLKNELPPPRQTVPGLSERVDWAIRRAMSADPNQRPASCREFVEDLTGQSTRMDADDDPEHDGEDVWYMVFTDDEAMVRTTSGDTTTMRQSLTDGQLGTPEAVRGSRSKLGPFEPLHTFPEFRDLVVQPAPGPPLSEKSSANFQKMGGLSNNGNDTIMPIGESPAGTATTLGLSSADTLGPTGMPAPPLPAPPPPEPAAETAPHFHLPAPAQKEPNRTLELVKNVVIVLGTLAMTVVAVRYLMPLLSHWFK